MAYKLRVLTFALQPLSGFAESFEIDTEVTASVETINAPFVIVGAQYKSLKSVAFDIDNVDWQKMKMTEYEAYKKLSLLPATDDNDNRFAHPLIFCGDLVDFEINTPRVILSGITPADFPVLHILEKI